MGAGGPSNERYEEQLRALLAETLRMWQVSGTVEPGAAGSVACIHAHDGTTMLVERDCAPGSPFRWMVRWTSGASAERTSRSRPCSSLVGVLSALRLALGVERGSALRIAAEPAERA